MKYELRPYKSVKEMDKDLIFIWNNQVAKNDLVYILGDFSFYAGAKTNEILKQLNGEKILIIGNHDNKFLKDKNFDKSLFKEICFYKEIQRNKHHIVMSHYPIADWNKKIHGSIHFYGHIHTIENEAQKYMAEQREMGYKCFNVGIDVQKKLIELSDFL